MVTPIWKWEFSIEAAPQYAYGALQRSEIPFANERLIMEKKWMFINWASHNGGPL